MRTQLKHFSKFLAIMVIGLIVACGGGGGSTPDPAPVPVKYAISGTITAADGAPMVGVSVSTSPSGSTPWVSTDARGFYTLTGFVNGNYTVTPFITGRSFTPGSATVTVSGKDVTGANFVSPLPLLNTGKLLYASGSIDISGFSEIYSIDLATGAKTTIYRDVSMVGSPDLIVPIRGTNKKIAYRIDGTSYGYDGIWNYDLTTGIKAYGIPVEGILVGTYWTTTFGSFDVAFGTGPTTGAGSFAAVTMQNAQGGKDIFLVTMDGTLHWNPVTTTLTGVGTGNNTSPVIINPGAANGDVTVLYLKNGNECWKQVVNYPTVTAPTLYLTGVMDSTRPMSVNADYTLLAYTKNVSGVGHIVVKTLASGAEVDLGPGSDPSWSFNGNGMLLYTSSNALWAVNSDGTGKIQVPTPSDLRPGALATVVFGPAGF